jgi:hypothetical protein
MELCCLHSNFDILLLWERGRTLMDAVHDTGIFDWQEQETQLVQAL